MKKIRVSFKSIHVLGNTLTDNTLLGFIVFVPLMLILITSALWLGFLELIGVVVLYDYTEDERIRKRVEEIYYDLVFGGEDERMVADLSEQKPEWFRSC